MSQKSYYILFTLLSVFTSGDYLLCNSFQVDSLKQSVESPSDTTQLLLLNDYYDFLNFRTDRLLLYDLPDTLFIIFNKDFLTQNLDSNNIFKSSMSEYWRMNDQLANYIKYQKGLVLKSDLGVFGKILGNAKNLTAVVLAILHVIKYKKGLY